jgi:predicted NAD/FAD-binding protein
VEVDTANGPLHVDTGFIVYNELNYPLLTGLFNELGVQTQPSEMSFSVRCDRSGLEYNGTNVRKLFVQKRNLLRLSHYRMINGILRFNRESAAAVANGAGSLTLGEYLRKDGFPSEVADHYLLPMGSALWSIPRGQVLEMPARFFVRFLENHRMLTVNDRPEWRVVRGGSSRYVEALTRPFCDRIRLSSPVKSIRRTEEGVLVDGEPFDEVVLACHSDQALALLADPTPAEREILGALPYQENEVVLHTDTSILPRRRAAWGAWNYRIAGEVDEPVSATYNMTALQGLPTSETWCVTLNPPSTLDRGKIVLQTRYAHPVYTLAGMAAQERHEEISGRNRTHFCGAYWGYGFHEDGVRSAYRVAGAIEAPSVTGAEEAHATGVGR